jgi:hypothetical protein
VQAQHHGLPTTLLDLTTNPLKALFFAVEGIEYDDTDGAVFLYMGSLILLKLLMIYPLKMHINTVCAFIQGMLMIV